MAIPAGFDPRNCKYGYYPTVAKSTRRQGSSGNEVGYLQGVLRCTSGQSNPCASLPGPWYFGATTTTAVRNFQSFWGLTVDGVVGPQTWGVIDWAAKGFPT